ncbi:MAG: Asp-tRNA(Asn)/Glu-tRNA(Gln) amidotransferase subunit GatA [Candidatus Aenigmarchaeota archaeon]|nr:Asp-tRNA(Asn)/Glu-tRNA(Gln) amidotransferase subunit GatA [Candidatus Aenigmarchaeota archaeon]
MDLKEYLENPNQGEVFEKIWKEVDRIQGKFGPFITVSRDEALSHCEKMGAKESFPGVPISVKDCLCTSGIRTTAGSRILETYVPPFDAHVVEKIKNFGYIIGKTAMDEFGFGTFSMNCAFGVPKNPLDPRRSCGGSSGGAACLTAALQNLPHVAMAESTGGSISCPASFCGVVGITPTYGRVSRYGMIDYASSLDKVGIIGKNCFEAAWGLSKIAGFDERDSTSINRKDEDYTSFLEKDPSKMRVGVPKEYFEGVNEEIKQEIWRQIKKLESAGIKYEEFSLASTKYALPSYYIIAMSEASTNLAKFCGIRYGSTLEIEGGYNEFFSKVRGKYFGLEAKRRCILGTFYRKSGYRDKYYLKALKVRAHLIKEFKSAFQKFDCIVTPTMPIVAPKFTDIAELTPAQHYAMDILTVGPNLCGVPHLSVPVGRSEGMPIGLHIIGDHLQEGKVFQLGSCIEKLN